MPRLSIKYYGVWILRPSNITVYDIPTIMLRVISLNACLLHDRIMQITDVDSQLKIDVPTGDWF